MYEQFFGLKDKPFSLTPNTRFVYPSTQFTEVEGQIMYGIGNHEALMLATGRPGTGKTTLCRALVQRLNEEKSAAALVLNPFLTGAELLAMLLADFGVNVPENGSYQELLDRLTQFVLAKHALGRRCVAIFDEAQSLTPEALEQIRVLTNLETDDEKLLQIVLVGQPELLEQLRSPRLAHLDQRVSVRCQLGELDEAETTRYVHHRLNVAGAGGEVRLTGRAIKELYNGSHGVPRLINLIADRSLLAGFASQTRDIDFQHVRKALAALRGEDSGPSAPRSTAGKWRRRVFAAVGLAVVGVGATGVSLWSRLGAATPEEMLYRRATMAYTASDAERDLRAFVTRYPSSVRTRDGLVRLAQLELSRGDRAAAVEHLTRLATLAPSGSDHSRAVMLIAVTQLDAADTTAACTSAAQQVSDGVSDSLLTHRFDAVSKVCAARTAASAPVAAPTPATPANATAGVPAKGAPVALTSAKRDEGSAGKP